MSNWFNWRVVVGALLVLFGALALVQALGLIGPSEILVSGLVALLFVGGGVAFLAVLLRDRRQWWAVIPGLVLTSIGVIVAYETFLPNAPDTFAGSIFLGGISLAFWLVYLLDRRQWWAVIPGGVLLTLAFIAGTANTAFADNGAAFFFGLGLTFVVVALLPNMGRNLRWAWIPAAVMLVMGAFLSLSATNLINYVWPVALILAGGYLVFRAYRKQV
jgi:hypothetical protein